MARIKHLKDHQYDGALYYYASTRTPNVCLIFKPDPLATWKRQQFYVNARIKKFEGKSIIGWKKVSLKDRKGEYSIGRALVELRIPASALRLQPRNKKCRASSAKVISIHAQERLDTGSSRYSVYKKSKRKIAFSLHDENFEYRIGKTVKPRTKFTLNSREECASGIHFYLTREEAIKH